MNLVKGSAGARALEEAPMLAVVAESRLVPGPRCRWAAAAPRRLNPCLFFVFVCVYGTLVVPGVCLGAVSPLTCASRIRSRERVIKCGGEVRPGGREVDRSVGFIP